MGLTASAKSETHFDPIPADTHQMVCYGVVDEGTQVSEYQGKQKKNYKIRIFWECPSERIDIEKDGKTVNLPRVISKEYTLSLGEKANLRKDLVSWRGRDFTEQELEAFNLEDLIGANCLIQIVHKEKNGKIFANIASIAKLMKGMARLNPESETIVYDMQRHGTDVPKQTPDWVRKIIEASPEFQAIARAQSHPDLNGSRVDNEPIIEPEDGAGGAVDDEDSIPF
jgi:hypothetical protein